MNTAQRIQAFVSLAEAAWKDFDTRRSYEWKLNLAMWAGLGTLAGFSIKEKLILSNYALIPLVVLFLTYVCIWTPSLRKRNWIDQQRAQFWWNKVAAQLVVQIPKEYLSMGSLKYRSCRWWALLSWSHGTQIIITFFFIAALGFALIRPDIVDIDVWRWRLPTTQWFAKLWVIYP